MRWIVVFCCLLVGCRESDETKKHRFLLKGNAALEDQHEEAAIRYFQEALQIDSCFADALNNLGTVYFRGKEYQKALEFYNQAVFCRPYFIQAVFNRANTLYELNQPAESLRDIERVFSVASDTLPAFFLKGLVLTKIKEYEQANEAFQEVLKKDSANSEVLVNLGTLNYYRKNYSAAVAYLKKALVVNPRESSAYNTWALIEVEKRNLDSAFQLNQRALAIDPGNAIYRNNRGYIYLEKGELTKALDDINFSIATDPYNGWAYRNKGIYFLKTGDAVSAIRMLTQALELEPGVNRGYTLLAEAYIQSGDLLKGCETYRKAMQKDEIFAMPDSCSK